MTHSNFFFWQKVTTNENVSFIDHASGIRLPDGWNFAVNWKKGNGVTICRHNIIVKFIWRLHVSHVKFSYWSKFHVNIMNGSGVTTISHYKGLTRNPKIGNTTSWILPNTCGLGKVRDTKFGTDISNKKLLNTAKCYCYSLQF